MPEDSLKIYNDVLKVLSVKEEPKLYAHANNRLGVCYSKRAIKGNKEENSTQAILAFKEVLKIYTIKEFPVYYAKTQNNLASAYFHLSKEKDKEKNLTKAIRAFKEAALKIQTSEKYSGFYETIMQNIDRIKRGQCPRMLWF